MNAVNKPVDEKIPAVVADLAGLPLDRAPSGLVDRLRGTDLDNPGDILRAVWILLEEADLDEKANGEPENLETKIDTILGELRALAAVVARDPSYPRGSFLPFNAY